MGSEAARSDVALAEIAKRQHGVVSAAQLAGAGLSRASIFDRVQAGRLHRVHRGVYAVGHARLNFEGRCMAAFLACCSDPACADAAVSHLSAAVLWGLLRPADGPIHVSLLSANGRARRPGIAIHRPPSLCSSELTRRSGIWVTKPARTLRDLRRTASRPVFQSAFRKALDLRLVADTAPAEDLTRSELERMFLRLCRRHHLPLPEVNARIVLRSMVGRRRGDDGGPSARYEVDFLWREARLIVETDGFEHHRHRGAFERDRARDTHLQALGYRVLRFTYRQVQNAPCEVATAVRIVLEGRATVERRLSPDL